MPLLWWNKYLNIPAHMTEGHTDWVYPQKVRDIKAWFDTLLYWVSITRYGLLRVSYCRMSGWREQAPSCDYQRQRHVGAVFFLSIMYKVVVLSPRREPQAILEFKKSLGYFYIFWLISLVVDCLLSAAWLLMYPNPKAQLTISLLIFKRKDLSHFPNSLCPSLPKEDPCSYFHKLRILDEPK